MHYFLPGLYYFEISVNITKKRNTDKNQIDNLKLIFTENLDFSMAHLVSE